MAAGSRLFISQHTNAYNGQVRGTEVFESVDLPDEQLASKMSESISTAIGVPNKGVKSRESINYPGEDYYTVIDVAQDLGVPHILLIESAYHDNPLDEAILKNDENLKKIAQAQSKVICEFFADEIQAIRLCEAVKTIIDAGVDIVPDYWLNNAQKGLQVKGEYAAKLIIKFADFIKKGVG